MKEIQENYDKPEEIKLKTPEKKINTFDDLKTSDSSDRIKTFDDLSKQSSPTSVKTFDEFRSADTAGKSSSEFREKELHKINAILEKTDPSWKEADKRTDTSITQKEFEKRGDWRREFASDAGKEEHKRWEHEVVTRETKAGRVKGEDYDIEPALRHPDGEIRYPDYVDYKKDIIVDRKPIGKNETENSVKEKYSDQRNQHIEAYEHSTGRKVLYYEYDFYPSPKDIY